MPTEETRDGRWVPVQDVPLALVDRLVAAFAATDDLGMVEFRHEPLPASKELTLLQLFLWRSARPDLLFVARFATEMYLAGHADAVAGMQGAGI